MKQNELSIRERLFSRQNIYLALYSVESYISNRELLDKEDKEELSRLKDKFNEENIEKWIGKIKERLHQLIDDIHYLHAKIFFKPKKYDTENDTVHSWSGLKDIWFPSCQQRRCGCRCRNGRSNLVSSFRWQECVLQFVCVQHQKF